MRRSTWSAARIRSREETSRRRAGVVLVLTASSRLDHRGDPRLAIRLAESRSRDRTRSHEGAGSLAVAEGSIRSRVSVRRRDLVDPGVRRPDLAGGRSLTGRVREVLAHLPSPGRPGASLCGEVTRIVRCEACDRRRDALLTVHIQSPRKPGKAFCGTPLRSAEIFPIGSNGADPPSLYISAERARDLAADVGSFLPICPGCSVNMSRFDEASARKSSRDSADDQGPVARERSFGGEPPSAPARASTKTRSVAQRDVDDDGEDYDD